jgi:hypothetical protein
VSPSVDALSGYLGPDWSIPRLSSSQAFGLPDNERLFVLWYLQGTNTQAGTFPGAESIVWYQGRGPREKQYRRRNP